MLQFPTGSQLPAHLCEGCVGGTWAWGEVGGESQPLVFSSCIFLGSLPFPLVSHSFPWFPVLPSFSDLPCFHDLSPGFLLFHPGFLFFPLFFFFPLVSLSFPFSMFSYYSLRFPSLSLVSCFPSGFLPVLPLVSCSPPISCLFPIFIIFPLGSCSFTPVSCFFFPVFLLSSGFLLCHFLFFLQFLIFPHGFLLLPRIFCSFPGFLFFPAASTVPLPHFGGPAPCHGRTYSEHGLKTEWFARWAWTVIQPIVLPLCEAFLGVRLTVPCLLGPTFPPSPLIFQTVEPEGPLLYNGINLGSREWA